MIDFTSITSLVDFTCKDLDSFTNVDSFKTYLSNRHVNISEVSSGNFMDFPNENTSESNKESIFNANIYSIEFALPLDYYGDKLKQPTRMQSLYINTINGTWIAIDLLDKMIAEKVGSTIQKFGRFEQIKHGYYKHKSANNYLRFTYFPEFDKYFAFFATNLTDLEHPIYSYNKIIDYLGQE